MNKETMKLGAVPGECNGCSYTLAMTPHSLHIQNPSYRHTWPTLLPYHTWLLGTIKQTDRGVGNTYYKGVVPPQVLLSGPW